MKFASTGAAAAAMIAFSALGITAAHTGLMGAASRGAAKPSAVPATFQMYANVDQLGNLGSNVGAKSATDYEDINYTHLQPADRNMRRPGTAGLRRR